MSTRRSLSALAAALLAILAIGVAATPARAAGFTRGWHAFPRRAS
jgi:hypothetical protein